MKRKNSFNFVLLTFLGTMLLFAQPKSERHLLFVKIPEVALINVINQNPTLTQKISSVIEAGDKILINAINNSTWINYSSIVGSTKNTSRIITVAISEGSIPKGLTLFIQAEEDSNHGDGKLGSPVTSQTALSETPITLIAQIGSAYTGKGINKGHQVKYHIALSSDKDAFKNLNSDGHYSISMTYTLSDN